MNDFCSLDANVEGFDCGGRASAAASAAPTGSMPTPRSKLSFSVFFIGRPVYATPPPLPTTALFVTPVPAFDRRMLDVAFGRRLVPPPLDLDAARNKGDDDTNAFHDNDWGIVRVRNPA